MEDVFDGDLAVPVQYVIGIHGKKYVPLICSGCDRELVQIYIVEENNKERCYQGNCPFCGGDSFKKRIKGKYLMVPSNTILLDISEDETLTIFTLGEKK